MVFTGTRETSHEVGRAERHQTSYLLLIFHGTSPD